jgi:hypothetical protein
VLAIEHGETVFFGGVVELLKMAVAALVNGSVYSEVGFKIKLFVCM